MHVSCRERERREIIIELYPPYLLARGTSGLSFCKGRTMLQWSPRKSAAARSRHVRQAGEEKKEKRERGWCRTTHHEQQSTQGTHLVSCIGDGLVKLSLGGELPASWHLVPNTALPLRLSRKKKGFFGSDTPYILSSALALTVHNKQLNNNLYNKQLNYIGLVFNSRFVDS